MKFDIYQFYMEGIGQVSNIERYMKEHIKEADHKTSYFAKVLEEELPGNQFFEKAFQFIIRNKRGYIGGSNPMKFGIMQSTLKDYDPQGKIARNVSELDENKARLLYRKIWQRAGCAKLPYPLNILHFDTYVQRPSIANEALKQSDGDSSVYIDVRKKLLSNLKTYSVYGRAWNKNIEELKMYINFQNLSKPPAPLPEVTSNEKQIDYFEIASAFVLNQEGGKYIPNDNGKGPSKYGILQSTLKIYDPQGDIASHVSELDINKAKRIYRMIWDDAGCEKLTFPLNIIHFDSFIHNPRNAKKTLLLSEGNPNIYLENRSRFLKSLKSYRYYGKVWENRLTSLSKFLNNDIHSFKRKL
ncbi:MAG: hypothetical protein N3A59_06450 [Thermodesulfovibrionales bacterium]|nr:hypothetical protein [Thermodesulfovibrionales bacterium]